MRHIRLMHALAALSLAFGFFAAAASPVSAHPTPEPVCDGETFAVVAAAGDAAMAELIASWQVLNTKCVVGPGDTDTLIGSAQQVVVLGGPKAVPDEAVSGLTVLVRLAGRDRIATAKAVLFWIESDAWRESDAATRQAEDYTVELVNELRVDLGVAPLRQCDQIGVVARRWSNTMAATSDYRHNPSYSEQYPAGWRKAAENIARRTRRADNLTLIRLLFEQFVNSPGHHKNMINADYNTIGVGFALNDESAYVTQNFAYYPAGSGECGQ